MCLGMEKKIEQWEMIDDPNQLRSLSKVHESLEWFANGVRKTLAQLPQAVRPFFKRFFNKLYVVPNNFA